MGPVPFDPIQERSRTRRNGGDILCQQHQPERQHPNPKNRQDAEERAGDEQQPADNPDPAEPGPAQPADGCLQPGRQPIDQPLDPPLLMLRRQSCDAGAPVSASSDCLLHRTLGRLVLRFPINRSSRLRRAAPRELAGKCRGGQLDRRAHDIDRSRRTSAPGTVIRHREVGRHYVGVLARGARIDRWPRGKKGPR